MLNYLRRWYFKYRWHKTKPLLMDESVPVLKRAKAAIGLFSTINRPDVRLQNCRNFYIKPASHSLHTMLSELERGCYEFQTFGTIDASLDKGQPERIRVDQWCGKLLVPKYNGIDIYSGYLVAGDIITNLISLIKTDAQRSYIERRCKKALATFVLLTELLGHMQYGINK